MKLSDVNMRNIGLHSGADLKGNVEIIEEWRDGSISTRIVSIDGVKYKYMFEPESNKTLPVTEPYAILHEVKRSRSGENGWTVIQD